MTVSNRSERGSSPSARVIGVPRVAVLNDYQHVAASMAEWEVVNAELQCFDYAFADERNAAEALQEFDVICAMRERLAFTASLLEQLPRLRLLVTTGSANRSIDLDAARSGGVVVSATTNGVGRLATAELTWALVLAANRNLITEDRNLRQGGWQKTLGVTLHGKTIGIVGLGGVGRLVARYARAFGMNILAWSPSLTQERAFEVDATSVGWDELLSSSDVVTVHVALEDETRGLIDAAALQTMRSSAILINTSRGPVVNEQDLIAAIRGREIAGAALDVFDHEPLPMDHPYRSLPDELILTPHIGYVARAVYETFYAETVEAVAAYLRGEPIRVLT